MRRHDPWRLSDERIEQLRIGKRLAEPRVTLAGIAWPKYALSRNVCAPARPNRGVRRDTQGVAVLRARFSPTALSLDPDPLVPSSPTACT
jgi:hypothetical protein